jgi:hypothetical protein
VPASSGCHSLFCFRQEVAITMTLTNDTIGVLWRFGLAFKGGSSDGRQDRNAWEAVLEAWGYLHTQPCEQECIRQ